MKTIKELKLYLKETAVEIRNLKSKRKDSLYGRVPGLERLRYEARHHHIAYCLLRGTHMDKIERSCRPDNYPNDKYIEIIMYNIQNAVVLEAEANE